MYNRYDQLSVPTLIRSIQDAALKLDSPEKRKTMSTAVVLKTKNELNAMRGSVIARLGEMDRTKPEFFPVGSRVAYQLPSPVEHLEDFSAPHITQKPKTGTVKSYATERLIVRFDSEEFSTSVVPAYVKLLFIRQTY